MNLPDLKRLINEVEATLSPANRRRITSKRLSESLPCQAPSSLPKELVDRWEKLVRWLLKLQSQIDEDLAALGYEPPPAPPAPPIKRPRKRVR